MAIDTVKLFSELQERLAPAKLKSTQLNGMLVGKHVQEHLGGDLNLETAYKAVVALRMNPNLEWEVEPKINLRDKGLLQPEVDTNIVEFETGKSKAELTKQEEERCRSEYRSAANTFMVYWRGRIEHSFSEESRDTLRQLIADCEKAGTPAQTILDLVTAKVNRLQRDFENRFSRNNGGR